MTAGMGGVAGRRSHGRVRPRETRPVSEQPLPDAGWELPCRSLDVGVPGGRSNSTPFEWSRWSVLWSRSWSEVEAPRASGAISCHTGA